MRGVSAGVAGCVCAYLMLLIERLHDNLELISELDTFELRRVIEAINHATNTAELKRLCDRLPAVPI